MTPTTTMGGASVLPTDRPLTAAALEQIAFNLCSLHDFDPSFVASQERFAKAVITEYERARPATSAASEVEGDLARLIAAHLPSGSAPDTVCITVTITAGELRALYAALASPPSERERELEANADLIEWLKTVEAQVQQFGTCTISDVSHRKLARIIRALTAQPAGEPTHG